MILIAVALTAVPQCAQSQVKTAVSCNQATTTKPQVGVGYTGDVLIDDYKLFAHIPDGLTGWGGVAINAPFHGFTIFLDSSMHSCIVFEIQLRIDDDEVPTRPHTAKTLLLGNATAWQVSNINNRRTRSLINVTTYFSSPQDGQFNDGRILLISRPEELQKTKSIYELFLKSVVFGAPTPARA